jgi:hypothetical protein
MARLSRPGNPREAGQRLPEPPARARVEPGGDHMFGNAIGGPPSAAANVQAASHAPRSLSGCAGAGVSQAFSDCWAGCGLAGRAEVEFAKLVHELVPHSRAAVVHQAVGLRRAPAGRPGMRPVVKPEPQRRPRYPPPQLRPGCRHITVTVGPGRSSVTVMVGPGRDTVTVTVGRGTGTLTVTVGVGFLLGGALVAPRRSGTVIATISASPMAAAITSEALVHSRFRNFLRCLRPGRGARAVITPLMVDPGAARSAGVRGGTKRCRLAPVAFLIRLNSPIMTGSRAGSAPVDDLDAGSRGTSGDQRG